MIVERKISKLILDTSAFLKNIPLWELGEEFYCVRDVIKEIKDRQTRQHIDALPIQLQFREPSPTSIKFINEFTKKTGDFAVLSLADTKILALTYELEVEAKGSSHLRSEPLKQRTEQIISVKPPSSTKSDETPHEIEGFYIRSSKVGSLQKEREDLSSFAGDFGNLKVDSGNEQTMGVVEPGSSSLLDHPRLQATIMENNNHEFEDEDGGYRDTDGSQEDEDNSDGDLSCESDDDEGWITPSNIKLIKRQTLPEETPVMDKAGVACVTGDFAMQNTLKHIGLHVMGVDGKIIQSVKTFILRCYACFKTTNRMDKVFCQNCGHKTLKRVSVTLNPDGTQQIWISNRRPINLRGTKFSLPRPKGGKHARNPILVADQREAQHRVAKLGRMKNDPMHEDYDTRSGVSPFLTRDVYSRSAQLGIIPGKKQHQGVYYWEQKNPNVPQKKGMRKKR